MRTKTRNLNVRNVAVMIDFVAMKLLSLLLLELKKRLQKSEEKRDAAEEAKLCNAIGGKYRAVTYKN